MAVRLAVAGDVFGDVLFFYPFSPRDVLDDIWDIIESVPEDFSHLLFLMLNWWMDFEIIDNNVP